MRRDIHKVICEKERRGARDYNPGRDYDTKFQPTRDHREDLEDDYATLDCLPKYESMTARLWDKRDFSDNLGVIYGLVRKAEGKNWDKIYSQLCQLVSPSGTVVQQHVHQHLDQAICRKTRLNEQGEVEGCGRYHTKWEPIKEIYQDYYVHPKTGCVMKVKRPSRSRKGHWKKRREAEIHAVFRYSNDPLIQYHKIDGVWYLVRLRAIHYESHPHKDPVTGVVTERWFEKDYDGRLVSRMAGIPGYGVQAEPALNERGTPLEYRPIEKRALNSKQLKDYGLENDKPDMDLTHNRRSHYG